LAVVLALLVVLGARVSSAQKMSTAVPSFDAARLLANAKSWGYQLQRIKPEALASLPYDVFVIDYSRDGSDEKALTPADVAALKRKPDGSRRIVLAYLSIGEAEKYRYYWQPEWETPGLAPTWLAAPNKRWRTNYPVRFWHPDWQAIVFTGEQSYLARIAAAGFDGVYLDGTVEPWACYNERHGCGYRAADGTLRPTYPIFGVRQFMQRLYGMFHPRGGLIAGDGPLQSVVQLLEDEGGQGLEIGREEVVQLAGVVMRERLECLALLAPRHDAPFARPPP